MDVLGWLLKHGDEIETDPFFELLKTRPLFVIVHEDCVDDKAKRKVIECIKIVGESIQVNDNPKIIPEILPKAKKILVCGAYRDYCVKMQLEALQRAGYNAEIYEEATQSG